MQRGDIWWATLPRPGGSEPGYRRPVLILQSDAFNKSALRTIVCVAITSNLRLADAPGNVALSKRQSSLNKASVVNVSQIVTLDSSYLTEHVGSLGRASMRAVEDGVRLVLGLARVG